MKLVQKLIITILLLTTSQMLIASNLNFLNESAPVYHFTDEDFNILMATIQKALNEKKDGEKLAWKNEKTGHAGLVNPLDTTIENNLKCRNTRLINRANKKIAQTVYKFCKQPDGVWKISQ
jgi:surface antigen